MAHIKDWMALAEPSAEWEAAVKSTGTRPDFGAVPDIPTLRAYIIESKKKLTSTFAPVPGVKEKDHQVPMRDQSSITVRSYTPENKQDCPLILVFHGGGWCIGGLENEELFCRNACNELGYIVLNVDYRLAPEHKFPTGLHDCYDATAWAAENAGALGADLSKGFVVAGTSAGANLATVVALQRRDEKASPPLTGCLLQIPPVCAESAVPDKYKADFRSWDQNEHADILSRKACMLFIANYVENDEDCNTQEFSPLIWKTGLKGFPPTFFQICGKDPLRDEALIFERALRVDEDVKTKVEVYPGLPHGFFSLAPTLPSSAKYVKDTVSGLAWLSSQV